MVKNIFNFSERENRIINIVKAKYGMKNKNQAVGFIIQTFAKHFLSEALRPIEKPKRLEEKKLLNNLDELREELKNKNKQNSKE
ncbi:MAG: DUF2683 family protein [Candidatus Pacearchaeota archaeon]